MYRDTVSGRRAKYVWDVLSGTGSELQHRGACCVSRSPPREAGLGPQVAFEVQQKLLMGRGEKAESRINPEKPLLPEGRWFPTCPWFAVDSRAQEI